MDRKSQPVPADQADIQSIYGWLYCHGAPVFSLHALLVIVTPMLTLPLCQVPPPPTHWFIEPTHPLQAQFQLPAGMQQLTKETKLQENYGVFHIFDVFLKTFSNFGF